jgi:hypothetical protein
MRGYNKTHHLFLITINPVHVQRPPLGSKEKWPEVGIKSGLMYKKDAQLKVFCCLTNFLVF